MSKTVDRVSVVSPKIKLELSIDNIAFFKCDGADLIHRVKPVVNTVERLINPKEKTVVFFWGYNPLLIANLCKLRSSNVRVVSMVYDTHLGSLKRKNCVKYILTDMFYRLGISLLNKLDAVVLFKESAKKHLRLKNKTFVVLPGIDVETIRPFLATGNTKTTFLFGGTLCSYNGIEEMISAFLSLERSDFCLKIYGNGPLKTDVEKAAKASSSIYYGGLISNEELADEIARADVLLNFRNTDSIVNSFAFPSKIVEYMSYGKPVLSTDVSGCDDFRDSVYLIEKMDKAHVASQIEHIINDQSGFKLKVDKSKDYLNKFHDNNVIYSSLYSFLFDRIFL